MIDASVISYAVKYEALTELQQQGVSVEDFLDEYRTVWRYLLRMKRDHDTIPSQDTLLARFPDMELPRVRRTELPMLLQNLRQRKKFIDFMGVLNDAASSGVDYESVDEVIQTVQGRLNTLAYQATGSNHLVNLFGKETTERMVEEIQRRRSGQVTGIPTGLKRFDMMAGGLHQQKMAVVIGRTGIGKSWLDLLLLAHAVMNGRKVTLYPLEMTLFEVATRLYSIFTQEMFGGSRVLKNLDLVNGKVNTRKVVRLLNLLEDKFDGQLYVADVGSLQDQYTVERIEAETESLRPDMFWVDYITLLKPPPGGKNDSEHGKVRQLSNGIAGIAKRRNTVGGCSAQVNREALKTRAFLPRLEHIAYGDSIGQDADYVFSLNRRNDYLYYSLVKNRGGMEIGKTRMSFQPNIGVLRETEDQDDDDSGD